MTAATDSVPDTLATHDGLAMLTLNATERRNALIFPSR